MSETVTCHDCGAAVPRRLAVLRSVSLREVRAWCRTCRPVTIPGQRQAPAVETVR